MNIQRLIRNVELAAKRTVYGRSVSIFDASQSLSSDSMNLLRVRPIGTGMHPDEVLVEVETRSGLEQLPVFRDEIHSQNLVRIGFPVDKANEHLLVELPSETARGLWRVWVKREDVLETHPCDPH